MRVLPDWIDSNEHMNVSRYDQLFDAAESAFYASCGIDRLLQAQRRGLFRLEKHLRYQREMRLGASIAITTQLIWTDLKRVHVFHQMWNADEGHRAATMECMAIHVNLDTRKPVTFDVPLVRGRIEAMARAHAALPLPDGAGRSVGRHPPSRG
ncbi:MAG: thioesterase family protein [Devosia sp.]|nr:thioesterase family protein [Devosia sp.]